MLQVLLHQRSSISRQRTIQIAGEVVPNVFALYDHGNHLLWGAELFS